MSAFPGGPVPKNTDSAAIALTKLLELFMGAVDTNGFLRITGSSINFKDLGDTPKTYNGYGGFSLRVKPDETGIEFSDAACSWGDITGDINLQLDLIGMVDGKIHDATVNLSDLKGKLDCSTNPLYPAAEKNDFYIVTYPNDFTGTAHVGGADGLVVEKGDFLYCTADSPAGTQAEVGANWESYNVNIPALSDLGLLLATIDTPAANSWVRLNSNGTLYVGRDIDVNSMAFDLSPVGTPAVGKLQWNATDHTLDLPLNTEVTLQIGQEVLVRVVNKSGTDISNGQVVRISGAQGQRVKVDLADATDGSTVHSTLGVATQDIANDGMGFITKTGLVRGLDTHLFSEGAQLWLHPTIPGGLTQTMPVAPVHAIRVATVVNSANGSAGSIFVSVDVGGTLAILHDVTLTGPIIDGQALIYEASTGLWKNKTLPTPETQTVTIPVHLQVAASDETTAITAGTNKVRFRSPTSFIVKEVRASLNVAQTGGSILTVDINENTNQGMNQSILTTKLTIDNGERTSTTAATPPVIWDNTLVDDAEIVIDVDQVGDGTAKGLKITIIGEASYVFPLTGWTRGDGSQPNMRFDFAWSYAGTRPAGYFPAPIGAVAEFFSVTDDGTASGDFALLSATKAWKRNEGVTGMLTWDPDALAYRRDSDNSIYIKRLTDPFLGF